MKQARQALTAFCFLLFPFFFPFFFRCLALRYSAGGKHEILQMPRIAVKKNYRK